MVDTRDRKGEGELMKEEKRRRIKPITHKHTKRLRNELTTSEIKLWSVLRNRQLDGYKFRRQHPINNYITDFCCEEVKLVIEIDGDTHVGNERYDEERTKFLEEKGYTVVRFTNDDVHENLEAVCSSILEQCEVLRETKQ